MAHYSEPEAKALAMSSGVAWVLTKPAHHDALLDIVGRALAGETESGELPDPLPSLEQAAGEHLRLLTDKLAVTVDALRANKARLTVVMNLGFELAVERDLGRFAAARCGRGTRSLRHDLRHARYC